MAGLAVVTILAGCERASDSASRGTIPADTVTAEQLALIGELDGAPEYVFGDVTSVAADRRGTIYVADRFGSTVRAYNAVGHFIGTVGAEGQGPGEFNWPLDIALDPVDRLYVRDRNRLAQFGRRPDTEFADSLIRTIPLGGSPSDSRRGKTDGSRYYVPSYFYYMFVTHRYFYLVVDSTGLTGDTVPVPSIAQPEVFGRANYPARGGRLGVPVEGINLAPFEAAPRWDITASGHVLVSPGDRYEITEWGPTGDTVRVTRHGTEPRPAPAAAARDSARAFRSRTDSIPVPLEEVRGMSDIARGGILPDVLPEILALHVGPEGNIWLRRWPRSDAMSQTVFDVLDSAGAPLGTVRVPADLLPDPPPWVSDQLIVGVITDRLTEIERVAVFALPDSWAIR